MKDKVDAQLQDQEAGFRMDQSWTDEIATLWIIGERSVEWNSSLYINFVDYQNAFGSVDRRSSWKLRRHYDVLEKIVNIIRNSYVGPHCKVMHRKQLTDKSEEEEEEEEGEEEVISLAKKILYNTHG
ncbi:unnamed protein product [Schistosoma mattheei]|uniref:Uncharacterized protein n=1 Tax=Schistosoma mattheei TaxID=31246 RepID=A0A183NSV3_9TREM|nr:unnamed protein product [Schistosoma mattheei]